MGLLDIIKYPVVTERSMLTIDERKYAFEVDTRTNKALIEQVVEPAFNVKIANVNILNICPELKRVDKYAGYTRKCRKTTVILTEDSKEIRLLEAAE